MALEDIRPRHIGVAVHVRDVFGDELFPRSGPTPRSWRRPALSYQLRAGQRCAYGGMLELDPSDEVKEKVSHNGISSLVRVLRPEGL